METTTPNNPAVSDVKTGSVQPATPPVTAPTTPNASDNTGVPTTPTTPQEPAIDRAMVTRLQQEISEKNGLLKAIGIEPDSDIGQKFKAGIVTKDDLINRLMPVNSNRQPETVKPPMDPISKILQIKNKASQGQATTDDFAEALEAIGSLASNFQKEISTGKADTLYQQCRGATLGAIAEDKMSAVLTDDLKQIEQQVFLSSTDNLLALDAMKLENPNSYFTPQAYQFYAKRNIENNYGKLRNAWIEYGKSLATGRPMSPSINPLSPSAGTSPAAPPLPNITKHNIKDVAKQYMASVGVAV